jgi:tRNA(fMet)-specific endonuclease VapC
MGLIIDTCIFIAEERGRFDWQGFAAAHKAEEARMSAITLSELLQGVHRAGSPQRAEARLRSVRGQMQAISLLPFGYAEAQCHAEIVADLESRGCLIGAYDAMIAATALANGWSVATLNLKEFQRVPALTVVDARPWQRV